MKKISPPTSIPGIPVFKGFDLDEPWLVPGYSRNLPHLRLEGATYFVTFRQADSIPECVMRKWVEERERWQMKRGIVPGLMDADPIRWKEVYFSIPVEERREFVREQQRRFFVELDRCHGSCVLEKAHSVVSGALDFFHGKRVWTGDYVVMPNHVHVLVQPFPGVKLEDWLYSVKRFSAVEIGKMEDVDAEATRRRGHFWQTESFDRIVRGVWELKKCRRYIEGNPGKLSAGSFVHRRMEWVDEVVGMG